MGENTRRTGGFLPERGVRHGGRKERGNLQRVGGSPDHQRRQMAHAGMQDLRGLPSRGDPEEQGFPAGWGVRVRGGGMREPSHGNARLTAFPLRLPK